MAEPLVPYTPPNFAEPPPSPLNVSDLVSNGANSTTKPLHFMVVSRARSGTTWLMDMLNQHTNGGELDTGAWGELLLDDGDARGPVELQNNLHGFVHGIVDAFAYGKGANWGTLEDRARFAQRPVQGFKWFNGQGGIDVSQMNSTTDWLERPLDPARIHANMQATWIFAHFLEKYQIRVVKLERNDFARFVSEEKMNHTAISACSDDRCKEKTDVRVWINPRKARKAVTRDTLLWQRLNSFFEEHVPKNHRYHISYTNFCSEPQKHMAIITELLGLPAFEYNTSFYKKLDSATTLRDSISNADEIAKALDGTAWEGQLDQALPCSGSLLDW